MSFPQDVGDMDRPYAAAGSIKRARERAQAGLPREDFAAFARRMAADHSERDRQRRLQQEQQQQEEQRQQQMQAAPSPEPRWPLISPNAAQTPRPRPQAPPGLQAKDGSIGLAISRPTQIPQWPLAAPLASPPNPADAEPYRPPPGRSQPPQRPPRPSVVPSILDGSQIQGPIPTVQFAQQNERESQASIPMTSTSTVSRASTTSSVGSIPDFPLPQSIPAGPPRRSVGLGPPPSSRRGASSFYSQASFVSPIPEESPRARSHTSFASSAAMPESWGTSSPGLSPGYEDGQLNPIYDTKESPYDEDDESRLVRSASIGKRGKAALVSAQAPLRAMETSDPAGRPGPAPIQSPFDNGTAYLEISSSSSDALPTTKRPTAPAVTSAAILDAMDAASAPDPNHPGRRLSIPSVQSQKPGPFSGGPFSRLSAIRRPPRLDIDAVRTAEARGSMTSLPDLIKRATRLAASLERGRRPASRFDDLDYSPTDPFRGPLGEKDISVEGEKHQSGLSDMLAAFPPPAHANNRRTFRQSFRDQVGSWPLPLGNGRSRTDSPSDGVRDIGSERRDGDRGRRCCGLPRWGFILLIFVLLAIIAAAVIVPIQFLVLRPQTNLNVPPAQAALQQCQNQLNCRNGGTNVVSAQGFCSCICTNGFTGFDCNVAGSTGCTNINISQAPGDTNINNVTIGNAIPRLTEQAQTNFSIPLSATEILAKLNTANLSCTAANALVTFNGQASRQGAATAEVQGPIAVVNNAANIPPPAGVAVVSVVVADSSRETEAPVVLNAGSGFNTIISVPPASTVGVVTVTPGSLPPTTTTTVTTTIQPSPTLPVVAPGPTFVVTEEVIDFTRVSVLFILQQKSLSAAESAQVILQGFFSNALQGSRRTGNAVPVDQAKNLTLGNGNSINLVDFMVDLGSGRVGSRPSA